MLKNRNDLATYFQELGFKIGAEIGVLGGSYSELISQKNPGVNLFCIDSWGKGEIKRKPYHLRKFKEAKERLSKYNVKIIHKFSMDAVKNFKDNSLDFVYIDANHNPEFVADDVREWSKKVRTGGIVAGHDFDHELADVIKDYTVAHKYRLHKTLEKDAPRSWWFIKQNPIKLSIIIAFYNSHGAVDRQVKHFAKMNLPDDIEFVFVDDGSSPPHHLQDYHLKNLHLLHTNDKRPWTQGLARNIGSKKAHGEYLLMTDIDHILSKEAIMDSYNFTGDKMIFPRHFGVLTKNGTLTQNPKILASYGLDLARLKTKRGLYASVHGNTFTIKKSTFELLGRYDKNHCLFGHHAGDRQGEDSVLNRRWNHYAAKNNIKLALGSKIYMFPIARYHISGDKNPMGLFHDLSQELVPQPMKK